MRQSLCLSLAALGTAALSIASLPAVSAKHAEPVKGSVNSALTRERGLPTNLINGIKPQGRVADLVNSTKLIDAIRPDGMQLLVFKGTRLPGTRVAIHIHEFSGYTCVLSGQITDFVEGKENATYGPGECYYMPANTPMSAANLGDKPAVLIDSFVVPPGKPVITKIEPGTY